MTAASVLIVMSSAVVEGAMTIASFEERAFLVSGSLNFGAEDRFLVGSSLSLSDRSLSEFESDSDKLQT